MFPLEEISVFACFGENYLLRSTDEAVRIDFQKPVVPSLGTQPPIPFAMA